MYSIRQIGRSHARVSQVIYKTQTRYYSNSIKMATISEAIKKDHAELKQYYEEVTKSNDHDHQQRYGNQFCWELARHSVAEELIVYPAFERLLGAKGKEMADEDRKEHHKA